MRICPNEAGMTDLAQGAELKGLEIAAAVVEGEDNKKLGVVEHVGALVLAVVIWLPGVPRRQQRVWRGAGGVQIQCR